MSIIKVDFGSVSGGGATLYRETIPNTGNNHHFEYQTKNAVGYIIANNASSTFLAFMLKNGVLTIDKMDSSYVTGVTYTSDTLSIDFTNGLWGNYFVICYE